MEPHEFLISSNPAQRVPPSNFRALRNFQFEVGEYPGVNLGGMEEDLLGRNYTERVGSGLLNTLSRFIIDYPGIKGRSQQISSLVTLDFCFSRIYLLAPEFTWIDMDRIQETLYAHWNRVRPHGAAFEFRAINATTQQYDVVIHYNKTLTRGRDVLLYMNMIGNAIWRTLRPNPLPFPTLSGTKAYPQPRTPNDVDFVTVAGRTS